MQSLRTRIHADFVLAVILTVIIPFGLLLRSLIVPAKYHQRLPLLAYWRASSLLMVTVYLLIAQRSYAMVSGITARIAIASALLRFPYHDDGFVRWWVWMTVGYCLSGAAINTTQIRNVAVRREYESATQVYAHLFHYGHDVRMLGRVGDVGLISWVVGAIVWQLRQR